MSEFSMLAKSLKGLYEKKSPVVTLEKLNTMLSEGKITDKEFNYIISE